MAQTGFQAIIDAIVCYVSHGGNHGFSDNGKAYYVRSKNGGDGFPMIYEKASGPTCIEFRHTIDTGSCVSDYPTGEFIYVESPDDIDWDDFDGKLQRAHDMCEDHGDGGDWYYDDVVRED
jgi:hypothetical protein